MSGQSQGSAGYGPGGAEYNPANAGGTSGSYGTLGCGGTTTYGNEQIIPLIGGSGGAGRAVSANKGGGAGGGAILIAANGTITIDGWIRANGGDGNNNCCGGHSGDGSGGGIRLVAPSFAGAGQLTATGGGSSAPGGKGRIRVEVDTITFTHPGDPVFSFAPPELDMRCVGGIFDNSPCTGGDCGMGSCTPTVPLLWPPSDAPRLEAVKFVVDAVDVPIPTDPNSSLVFPDQDVSIDSEDPLELHIAAANVPLDWIVEVRAVAKSGLAQRITADPLVGTLESSTTTASVTLPRGFSGIQLRAFEPTP